MLLFKYYLKNSEIIFYIGLLTKKYSYKKIRCFKVAKKSANRVHKMFGLRKAPG